jgi:hypothetical protein
MAMSNIIKVKLPHDTFSVDEMVHFHEDQVGPLVSGTIVKSITLFIVDKRRFGTDDFMVEKVSNQYWIQTKDRIYTKITNQEIHDTNTYVKDRLSFSIPKEHSLGLNRDEGVPQRFVIRITRSPDIKIETFYYVKTLDNCIKPMYHASH